MANKIAIHQTYEDSLVVNAFWSESKLVDACICHQCGKRISDEEQEQNLCCNEAEDDSGFRICEQCWVQTGRILEPAVQEYEFAAEPYRCLADIIKEKAADYFTLEYTFPESARKCGSCRFCTSVLSLRIPTNSMILCTLHRMKYDDEPEPEVFNLTKILKEYGSLEKAIAVECAKAKTTKELVVLEYKEKILEDIVISCKNLDKEYVAKELKISEEDADEILDEYDVTMGDMQDYIRKEFKKAKKAIKVTELLEEIASARRFAIETDKEEPAPKKKKKEPKSEEEEEEKDDAY